MILFEYLWMVIVDSLYDIQHTDIFWPVVAQTGAHLLLDLAFPRHSYHLADGGEGGELQGEGGVVSRNFLLS